MEFFEEFSWAMPKAFTDALAVCKFVEGDTVFDTAKAYGSSWSDSKPHINYHIQVREPKRTTAGAEQESGSLFEKNWTMPARVELVSYREENSTFLWTTQGRLYTAFWRGDLSVLDLDVPSPKPPIQLKGLHKRLKEFTNVAINQEGVGWVFIMTRDQSLRSSCEKHYLLMQALAKRFSVSDRAIKIEDAGVMNADIVSPTIDVVCYLFKSGTECEIREALKEALYKPSKNAKTSRFRLEAHGLLVEA